MGMSNCNEIIERLENLANHAVHYVDEPPFIMSLDDGIALHDAVAILKAQEPRVMTLEELAAARKTPVWRETKRAHKDLYNGWMLAYDIQRGQGITGTRQGMTEPNGRIGWYKLDDYGKTWRCWTARPDEKTMEVTPWQ